jgi:hypothetical protein
MSSPCRGRHDCNYPGARSRAAPPGKLRNGESAALLVERAGTQIFVPIKAG